jgi:hypothetical protein
VYLSLPALALSLGLLARLVTCGICSVLKISSVLWRAGLIARGKGRVGKHAPMWFADKARTFEPALEATHMNTPPRQPLGRGVRPGARAVDDALRGAYTKAFGFDTPDPQRPVPR